MKTNVMQIVRLVMMIVAVAGIIYALEYMERGIAVWFWITLLGVGFVGLLYTFRLTQRRVRLERRARERQEKKKSRRVETLTFIRRTSLPGGSVRGFVRGSVRGYGGRGTLRMVGRNVAGVKVVRW